MLEPTPPEEVIKNLKLDYTSGHRLFGNIQVDGTIENNGCITIYDTKIKATITHKDGTTSNEEISINVGIGDHSKIEFQEIIAASWSDEISLKITSARY